MAITYVGSNTALAISTSGADVNFSLPASNQGDLVLIISGCSSNAAGPPSTAGYTSVSDTTPIGGERLCVHRKFMGATPDTTVNITGTGDSNHLGALALVFRGVNTTTPVDVAVTTANSPGGSVPNPAAITPTSNDCCIVIAATAKINDTSVGSVTNYLPSPSVQISEAPSGSFAIGVAGSYRILSGGASTSEDPLAWSTWSNSAWATATIALRPLTASVDLVTVNPATITATGKAVAERETTPVLKASVGYAGRTVTIPDGLVDNITVDKYRVAYTGKTVEPLDIIRSVTVTKASVLYRGRIVTPRDVQFEDIPRYAVKGRGSGHWMETR